MALEDSLESKQRCLTYDLIQYSMAATERGLSLCCLYFIVLFAFSQGFNFDARFAVIKKGPKNSYFGFSVAEHQIVDEDTRELLPKGNV